MQALETPEVMPEPMIKIFKFLLMRYLSRNGDFVLNNQSRVCVSSGNNLQKFLTDFLLNPQLRQGHFGIDFVDR